MEISKLKILELASVLAGPSVGTFFSELGCNVIKIENKVTNGDVTRQWKLDTESRENSISAYYAAVNYGKKSIMLDFYNDDDLQKLKEFIANCDIVIMNFKQDDYLKFNLDFESIKRINPKIIFASISGFENNNPRVAYDLVLQAEAGFMDMNGATLGDPTKFPIAIIDLFAAHQLKEAILIALYEQMFDLKAKQVSVSLYESAIACLANQATNFLMENQVAKRQGSLHPNIAPYGEIFITKDNKSIVLAIGSNKQFDGLMDYLDIFEVYLFKNNQLRITNRKQLELVIQSKIEKIAFLQLENDLLKRGIPFGRIRNIEEVFENPIAKEMILTEIIEGQMTKRVKTIAFKMQV